MPGPEDIERPCNGLIALSIHRGAPAFLRAAGQLRICCFPVEQVRAALSLHSD